jgi:hypothetical protein
VALPTLFAKIAQCEDDMSSRPAMWNEFRYFIVCRFISRRAVLNFSFHNSWQLAMLENEHFCSNGVLCGYMPFDLDGMVSFPTCQG